jgi:hypothetical protein
MIGGFAEKKATFFVFTSLPILKKALYLYFNSSYFIRKVITIDLMANILSTDEFILDDFNPGLILRNIAERARKNRLELNLSQSALASKSGVSLGSLKRFESTSEISLKNLVMLALILDATEEFGMLFKKKKYKSIDELLNTDKLKVKKRGRKNV